MTNPSVLFRLPREIEAFRRRVIDVCDEHVRPRAAALDESAQYPADLHRMFAQRGLLRAIVPDDCGGLGLGHLGRTVLIEEVARASAAVSMIPQVNELGCTPLALAGTLEQRRRWVVPVARGELFASYGLTEADAGSDVAALGTCADRDGGDWLISGGKAWICNVQQPGFCIVFARTSGEGNRGLTAFIVPTDTPGFVNLGPEPAMGLRGSPSYNLAFDRMRVPDTNRLGEVGSGFKLAMRTLDRTRAAVAAQALGIARAAFEAALQYASQRRTFGVPIIEHQAVASQIAEMDMKVRATRLLAYEANAALDEPGAEGSHAVSHSSSVAKCFASDAAMQVALAAVDIFGGHGYSRRHPVERYMRDAKVTQLYEGANGIQRLIIARNLARAAADTGAAVSEEAVVKDAGRAVEATVP